jgi:hypothetical protein
VSLYDAWLDESGSNRALDPHTYILSAVICEDQHVESTRDQMRILRARSQRKLHWRNEDHDRRALIARTIAKLHVEHLVVIRSSPTAPEKSERQRRLCMERMLPELVQHGVGNAYLESRGPQDDRRDHQTLNHLRRKRRLTGPLHIDHLGGPADPMLWIPDACCGAIAQMRSGNHAFYAAIKSRVTIIDV